MDLVVRNGTMLEIKKIIPEPLCTPYFDELLKITMHCDVNPNGIGRVLSQADKFGVERPVAFYLRSLNETECRYAQTENLSVVCYVKKWHY